MGDSIVSKLVASTISIPNELSLAAANFNLDFTLIKLEAPSEFGAVQKSLSPFRRKEAEEGGLHRTARKLGALFHGVVSPAPALLSAYGSRVSQIAEKQKLEPSERAKHGIFSYISGADASSIWAAATSGENAILVHLLACMVASMFDAPQAVALWMELIDRRQAEAEKTSDSGLDYGSMIASTMAARQQFTREELATWDNGARAWLQSANVVMRRQREAALEYTDTAATVVNPISDVYLSVIRAWEDAMVSMDSLVRGVPQKVRNGAVLLAMNSWHLYPDLCVLSKGPDVLFQHDDLIMESGILSIDLEPASDTSRSVSWSLPLSYMRYYGDPVVIERQISVNSARLTMEQFSQVLLGCTVSAWTGFADSTSEIADIMSLLMEAMRRPEILLSAGEEPVEADIRLMKKVLGEKSWVGQLFAALEHWKSAEKSERAILEKLITHGRRHGQFLCDLPSHPAPFFGLSQFPSLFSLLNGHEARITCLRQYAKHRGLSNKTFVISYIEEPSGNRSFATIAPVGDRFGMGDEADFPDRYARRASSNPQDTSRYARWLPIDTTAGSSCACKDTCVRQGLDERNGKKSRWQSFFKTDGTAKACSCLPAADQDNSASPLGGCSIACHPWSPSAPCIEPHMRADSSVMKARINYVQQRGEYCFAALRLKASSVFRERIDFGNGIDFETSLAELPSSLHALEAGTYSTRLQFYAGDTNTAMIVRPRRISQGGQTQANGNSTGPPGNGGNKDYPERSISAKTLQEIIRPADFNSRLLTDWFATDLRSRHRIYVSSLQACAAAFNLYRTLPNTTVSPTVVSSTSLPKARWFPQTEPLTASPLTPCLSRPEAFACIAMFEAGKVIEPAYLSAVFAMTSGDSIFVASQLLEDPYQLPAEDEIRRIPGNLGRPGLSFLVPPPNPKIRAQSPGSWDLVNHSRFNGDITDSFWQTSMHLTLTQYQPELRDLGANANEHYIDQSAFLRESLVQVHDGKHWLCDLDILGTLSSQLLSRVACKCAEGSKVLPTASGEQGMVTVDNWEELLTRPLRATPLVVRAAGNFFGRLAAAGLSTQLGRRTVILPKSVCWLCTSTHIDGMVQAGVEAGDIVLVL